MGGFGTFTYASRHPDLFTAALSLSGAVDPTTRRDRPGVIDAISAQRRRAARLAVGPAETQEVRWRAHNPHDLAENLRGLALWLRTGNGEPGGPFGGGPTSTSSRRACRRWPRASTSACAELASRTSSTTTAPAITSGPTGTAG